MTAKTDDKQPGALTQISYLADTERDAQMLRFQVDVPVLVRSQSRAGGIPTPGTSQTSETSETSHRPGL